MQKNKRKWELGNYPCRNYKIQPVSKRILKQGLKDVVVKKVCRNKKDRKKFKVTTAQTETLKKLLKMFPNYPNININIAIDSDKFGGCKRSPKADYLETDMEQESNSEQLQHTAGEMAKLKE